MYCIYRTRVIHQDAETVIYAHVVSDKEGHRRQVYSVDPPGILVKNLPDILLGSKRVACICLQTLDLLFRQEVECPFCHSINIIHGNIHYSNEFYKYVSLGGSDEWKGVDRLTEELKE